MNRACFPKENTRIHKNGEIHELFVLALSLVWFAGATPDGGCFRHFYTFSLARGEGKQRRIPMWEGGGFN